MTRIVVTGGRGYNDRRKLFDELDAFHAKHPITLLIEGGAAGADAGASQWADYRGVEHVTVAADWGRHGKSAGPIRNAAMLDYQPACVVAFPGGVGTANCIRQARARGIPVLEVGRASAPSRGGAA